jgi:hypothetical protein
MIILGIRMQIKICTMKRIIFTCPKKLYEEYITVAISTNSKNKDYLLEDLWPRLGYKQNDFAFSSPRT